MIDTILQNRYRIQRQLGQGGMGTVYLAADTNLERTVAVKVMQAEFPAVLKAIEREAKLLSRLRHPALPVVIDYFSHGKSYCIVMDFVQGEDLMQVLRSHGSLGVEDAVRIARELLTALEYLHSNGVIHRDIKPSNLKLSPAGRLMVLDFGLAKGAVEEMSKHSKSRSLLAFTLEYAPLEQIQSTGTDARSDLYSVAATLYHLLTGRLPASAMDRTRAIVSGKPDPLVSPDTWNPTIPPSMARLIVKGLAMDPAQRPQSAGQFLAELQGDVGPAAAPPQHLPTLDQRGTSAATRSDVIYVPTKLEASRPVLIPTKVEGPGPQTRNRQVLAENHSRGQAAILKRLGLLAVAILVVGSVVVARMWLSFRGEPVVRQAEQPETPAVNDPIDRLKPLGNAENVLRPAGRIALGAPMGRILRGSDERYAYFINEASNSLVKLDLENQETGDSLELAPGAQNFCFSGEGLIYTCSSPNGHTDSPSKPQAGVIQVVDPQRMQIVRSIALKFDPFDIAVGNDNTIYLTGGSGQHTKLIAMDPVSFMVTSQSLGIYQGCFLRITPDGNRLYTATNQSSSGAISATVLPIEEGERSPDYASAEDRALPRGGSFEVSPDGEFVIVSAGAVLRIGPPQAGQDLSLYGHIEEHLVSLVLPQQQGLIATTTGSDLFLYSYPDFKLKKSFIVENPIYRMVFDEQSKMLYAAVDEHGEGRRSRTGVPPTGDILVYDLRAFF